MKRGRTTQHPVWISVIRGQSSWWFLRVLLGAFALGLGPAAGPIRAQTNPAALPVVRFTVFAAEPIEGLGYLAQPGGVVVPLTFYPTARSPRQEHRGPRPLRLVETNTGATVAEVAIPAGWRDVLLLVASTPGGTGLRRYQVTVLDDGPRQRAAGQLQILNFSGLELSGELNGRRISIEAGLNPALSTGRSARLTLRASFRGRSYLSWHDTITLGPAEHAVLILFPPYFSGSLEVQTRVLLDGAFTAAP